MKHNQHGSSIVIILISVLVIGVVGFAGWRVMSSDDSSSKATQQKTQTATNQGTQTEQKNTATEQAETGLIWRQGNAGWEATLQAPSCPDQPMLSAPADLSKATAVLYPGQKRGGNYKPHGGFRFDNSSNSIEVTAPMDGYLVRGVRYIEIGEVQYMFDFINNCGIGYRLDHLNELSPFLQKIADTLPEPTESTATHNFNPAVLIKKGDVIATKVGFVKNKNASFDLGVYDYRATNEASKSAAYQSTHANTKETAWHAVCWLKGWLPKADEAMILKLPAGDPGSGKTSDYCTS